jgi:hypothetical protein
MNQENPTPQELSYEDIHLLVEDAYISWRFIKMNMGDCPLKEFHRKRFDHITNFLEPLVKEVMGNEQKVETGIMGSGERTA